MATTLTALHLCHADSSLEAMKILSRAARRAWTCPVDPFFGFQALCFQTFAGTNNTGQGVKSVGMQRVVCLLVGAQGSSLRLHPCSPETAAAGSWHQLEDATMVISLFPSIRTACLPFLILNFLVVLNPHSFCTNSSSQRVGVFFPPAFCWKAGCQAKTYMKQESFFQKMPRMHARI